MTVAGWIEILLFIALLTALTPLVGRYMAWVFAARHHARPRRARAAASIGSPARQDWKRYARSVLIFSALFGALLYVILRTQSAASLEPA